MERLIERTGAGRDPGDPAGLRRTVGGIVREDADPNPEIGGPETGGDRRGTETGTVTETGTETVTVIEIGTRIGGADPRAEDDGRMTAAGLLGPVRPRKLSSPSSPSNRRGKYPEGSLRSREWPLQPGKVTTDPLVRRQPP